MHLLDFINTHKNWEEILSNPPYCLMVKKDEDLILLKYNQIESDFSLQEVQEARGCIIQLNQNSQPVQYQYVCRPFDKFFNYGETNACDIDWSTAYSTAKVDGSLHKIFYLKDKGEWRLATNGTINAFTAEISNTKYTFGQVFLRALELNKEMFQKWCDNNFNKDYTYMFELTSPINKVVIDYPYGVYLLAARHTENGKYLSYDILKIIKPRMVQYPKLYDFTNLSQCIEAVDKMSFDEEGIVIADKQGNRIKIKSKEYLIRARLLGKGQKGTDDLLQVIFEEKEDDLLAYCPEYSERVQEIKDIIQNKINLCNQLEKEFMSILDRKEFALAIKDYEEKGYLFAKRDGKVNTLMEYLKRLTIQGAMKMLQID